MGLVQEDTLASGTWALFDPKMSAYFLGPLFWACLALISLEADPPHPVLCAFSSLPPFGVMK